MCRRNGLFGVYITPSTKIHNRYVIAGRNSNSLFHKTYLINTCHLVRAIKAYR